MISKEISCVILAGGKSSRMGTDKGLMDFNGKPMIQHIIDLVQKYFSDVMIISNNDSYKKFNLPVYPDEFQGSGPVVGILTGLTKSSTAWNFVVACDLPFLNSEILELLISNRNGYDAVVPFHHGNPEPMCAMYNKSCLPAFKNNIASGVFKIQDAFPLFYVNYLQMQGHLFHDKNPFINLNSKEDIDGRIIP